MQPGSLGETPWRNVVEADVQLTVAVVIDPQHLGTNTDLRCWAVHLIHVVGSVQFTRQGHDTWQDRFGVDQATEIGEIDALHR